MVHDIQQNIGEELAGQVANGQPARPEQCQQIVAGKQIVRRFVTQHAISGSDDPPDQVHEPLVADVPADDAQQDLVIDVGKEPHDIGLQVVAVTTQVALRPIQSAMRPFPPPTRIAVEVEAPLEQGLQHSDDGVMDDPVAKGGSAAFFAVSARRCRS